MRKSCNYYQNIELAQKKLEFFMGQPIDLTLKKIKKPTSILSDKMQHIVTVALEWQEPKKIMLLPIKTYYKYAMKNREELKIASKNIGIAKDQVYIAQRSNLPRIDIVGATGHQSQIGLSPCGLIEGPLVQNVPHNFYNIGVQFSWPIFNGLLNNNIEKEAHATMLKEILNKDHSLQEIKFAIDTAYHVLKQALFNLKAKKFDLIYARNNIKLKRLQFRMGDISKIELDLALADWERAEYTWIDLIVDAAIKEKNLAFACGYPKELF